MDSTQTLYLNAWEYNRARLIARIEKVVLDNGGAIVSKYFDKLDNYCFIPRYRDHVDESKPFYTNYKSYINFLLDGFIYYIQIDDNFLFDHYFQKMPAGEDLIIKYKYYLEKLDTSWIFDCLFSFDCNEDEIKEIANLIINQVLNFKNYQVSTTRRRKYTTAYGSGANKHHYIYENIPDKEPTYGQKYRILKQA